MISFGEEEEEPEGAPRSTWRKKAKGMIEWRICWASSSELTFGAFLSFA